jgi:hypothetical protein
LKESAETWQEMGEERENSRERGTRQHEPRNSADSGRIPHCATSGRTPSRERGSSGSGGFARIRRRSWQTHFAAESFSGAFNGQLSAIDFQARALTFDGSPDHSAENDSAVLVFWF